MWSAAISAGAGLLSGVLGGSSASKQAQAQLQATRETNAQNYKIWQEQKQHNVDMYNLQQQGNIDLWNMQNEYNDPSAQLERLANAGLNPALALGNNPTGNASSAPDSASINGTNSPTMQTADPSAYRNVVSEAFANALQSASAVAGTFNTFAHTQGQQIANDQQSQLTPWLVESAMGNAKKTSTEAHWWNKIIAEQWDSLRLNNDITSREQWLSYDMKMQTLANQKAENVALTLDNKTNAFLLSILPQKAYVELMSNMWNATKLFYEGAITEKQFRHFTDIFLYPVQAQTAKTMAEAGKIGRENWQFDQTKDEMVRAFRSGYIADAVGNWSRWLKNSNDGFFHRANYDFIHNLFGPRSLYSTFAPKEAGVHSKVNVNLGVFGNYGYDIDHGYERGSMFAGYGDNP